ncbi:MAG: hypothetical protein NTW21_26120 [Verrucomicrobia bacterium]|nr:hypothetical protein [Verrucomicrobiota bacterium]
MESRAAICIALGLVWLNGCRDKAEVTITETRVASTRDGGSRLFATSDERFSNAQPSPVKGDTPPGWTVLPANEFRLLNYRFGPSGTGEVWVSGATGSVAGNVNRWLHQFGAQPLDEAGIKALRSVPILGATGVWVQAQGDYAGGMDAPPKPGYGLAGVIAEFQGQLLTVKMVAPAAEVRFGIPALEAFVKSLRLAEP